MSFIVNGNQQFTKVRNVASADIQRLQADEIVVNKLRVSLGTADPATVPSKGNAGDVVFWNAGGVTYMSVCIVSSINGSGAEWSYVALT